jgi:transposase-like protein
MNNSILSAPFFHDEAAAYERLEAIVWPSGPVCMHCGCFGRITPVRGKTARIGLKRCGDCKLQFRVTVGTVFEGSHIKLHIWLQAVYLMCASKKGISAHQLHRTLNVTYKTAWFMEHRIREAMTQAPTKKLGGKGKYVESDETYWGLKRGARRQRGGFQHKNTIMSLVERGAEVRSFHVPSSTRATVREVLDRNIEQTTHLMTDEAKHYRKTGRVFAQHSTINHTRKEYVRGSTHTNTIEGFFSIFKRGMRGVYQHCGEQHLGRYLAEFDFRYNNRITLGVGMDIGRLTAVLQGIVGKRLMYRDSCVA